MRTNKLNFLFGYAYKETTGPELSEERKGNVWKSKRVTDSYNLLTKCFKVNNAIGEKCLLISKYILR